MTDHERAMKAWESYRDSYTRNNPRRQLRRREFIAGFVAGATLERDRTQRYVTPMNQKLYSLVRDLDENPGLAKYLQAAIPETIKKLVTFLETGVYPKDQK